MQGECSAWRADEPRPSRRLRHIARMAGKIHNYPEGAHGKIFEYPR